MKSSVIFALLEAAKADQPVHCLSNDILGDWTFHISADQQLVNLFESEDLCTHKQPNGLQIITGDHKFKFDKETTLKVKLLEGARAEA